MFLFKDQNVYSFELKRRDGPARSESAMVRYEPLRAEASRRTGEKWIDNGEARTIASWSVATDWREANWRQWGAKRCELKRCKLKRRDRLARSESATVRRKPLRAEVSRRTGKKRISDSKATIDRRRWGEVYRRLGLELLVREWESGEWGSEITKQKGLNIIFTVKLIVTKFIFCHY